jgi:hypothetical protein
MHYTPLTQPARTSVLLGSSFKLYNLAFKKVILLGLALAIISFMPRLIILSMGHNVFLKTHEYNLTRLIIVLIDISALIFFAAILWQVHSTMVRVKENIAHDMNISIHKLPYIIVASIIQILILGVVALAVMGIYLFLKSQDLLVVKADMSSLHLYLLGVPMLLQILFNVYLFVLLIFYMPLIVIENKGIVSSLAKSARLVWGNWWRTLWFQSIPWLIYVVALMIVKYTFKLPINIYFVPMVNYSWVAVVVHMLMFGIFIAWYAAALLVQLNDLELRRNQKLIT